MLSFLTFVLTVLALGLLIVPGVILKLLWIVAVPAFVIERLGIFDSMTRSSELTRGIRLRILPIGIVILLAEGLLGGLGFAIGDPWIYSITIVVVGVVIYPYLTIITTVLYLRLIKPKES